jgi:hypothetical protein
MLLVAVLAGLLGACGGEGGSGAATSGQQATTGPADPATSEAGSGGTATGQSEEQPDMSIHFAVEGGFANLARSITIGDGGAAEVETSGTTRDATVDPATVEQIVAELEASGLFDRDRRYDAEGADLQRYEIRYAGATVVAFDTAVPGELTGAIELLEAAIRAARTG